MGLSEGFQWEEFTRSVVAQWTAGDSVNALATLERVGRFSANDLGADGWWERSVGASSLGGPLRAAWFMTALAIVGDELSVGDARVSFALNRARAEASLAGVNLRSLSDAFVRVAPLRVDALASLLLRRARALAASPPPDPSFDATAQVLDLFAEAIGAAPVTPRAAVVAPRAPPEPFARTAGVPMMTSTLPIDASAAPLYGSPPFSTGNERLGPAEAEALSKAEFRVLASRWLAPIEGDAPAGVDATYDERMQRIVERVNLLESATNVQSKSRLWREVGDGASTLLRDVTKDLTLASYFAHAMVHLEGPIGLARGLALLTGLVEDYWPTMLPPASRAKRRANALAWYSERTLVVVEGIIPRSADAQALTAAVALVDRLSAAARGHLGGAMPPFQALREAIERCVVDANPRLP